MSITESDDTHLRKFIFEKEKVIVKFVDDDCPVCKTLAPSFLGLSTDPAFQDIAFLRMDASENPVSRQEVKLTGTPFFATYKKGRLQECGVVATAEGIRYMLLQLK